MIPLIEREIVKKRWMSKEDFMEMFALTQSLPGVFAVNISIFVGYKLHKVKGSLVCALATILPSFVIMMLEAPVANTSASVPVQPKCRVSQSVRLLPDGYRKRCVSSPGCPENERRTWLSAS